MKRRGITVLLVVGMLAWAGGYAADTTFRVSATVNAVCDVTATDLSFGTYNSNTGIPLRATTAVRVTCTPNTSFDIGLNAGTSPGATVIQRKMVSGANVLNYNLYRNSSHSEIWGNEVGIGAVSGVGTGVEQVHTVFGEVPAKQVVQAGNYADTITVTIYY